MVHGVHIQVASLSELYRKQQGIAVHSSINSILDMLVLFQNMFSEQNSKLVEAKS